MRVLFRGVNATLHRLGLTLQPKRLGPFTYPRAYGEATYGDGGTYGTSEANAVVRHQLDQRGFPTSGISTTPVYDRAVFYATTGRSDAAGFVYTIDRDSLSQYGVKEYIVSDYAVRPSVPADEEVILVAADGGFLPQGVVLRVEEVRATPSA
jgi:hypothetical protein